MEDLPHPPRKLTRTKSQLHTDHLRDELGALLEQARTLRVKAMQVAADTEHVQRQIMRYCTHDDGYSELEHCTPDQRSELQAIGDEVLKVLSTIKVDVVAARDGAQSKCYKTAVGRVEGLEADLLAARKAWNVAALDALATKISPLLNACSPEPAGIVDSRFMSTALGMTLLDQKLIRGRLADLAEDVDRLRERVAAHPDSPPTVTVTEDSEPPSSPSPTPAAPSPKPTWAAPPPPPPPAPPVVAPQPRVHPRAAHRHGRARRQQAAPAPAPAYHHAYDRQPLPRQQQPDAFGYPPPARSPAYGYDSAFPVDYERPRVGSRRRGRQRDVFGLW